MTDQCPGRGEQNAITNLRSEIDKALPLYLLNLPRTPNHKMAIAVLNPLIDSRFGENVTAHLTCYQIPLKIEETPIERPSFFDEQIDLTSEIMSFLDVESLLNVCQVSKVFPSCLRHDHVTTSALSTKAPLQLTSTSLPISPEVSRSMFTMDKEKKAQHLQEKQVDQRHGQNLNVEQTREFTIMKRLLQVFEHYNSISSSTGGALHTMAMQNVERPSPMRLLRLVNGKKCEKCNRRLSPFSIGSGVVLPSLTFGKFCCTKCIFK